MTAKLNGEANGMPDIKVSVKQLFGFDSNLEVPAFS
ncbi:MAG: cobaltochelatase subunit CobS, partial [Aestuariivirga sp.]